MKPRPLPRRPVARSHPGITLRRLLLLAAPATLVGALLWAVVTEAREKLRSAECAGNAQYLTAALRMYYNDYNETTPLADSWSDGLVPYLRKAASLHCPADPNRPGGPAARYSSFALLAENSGRSLHGIPDSGTAVLLFEARGNHWNLPAVPDAFIARHEYGQLGGVLYAPGPTRLVPPPKAGEPALGGDGQ